MFTKLNFMRTGVTGLFIFLIVLSQFVRAAGVGSTGGGNTLGTSSSVFLTEVGKLKAGLLTLSHRAKLLLSMPGWNENSNYLWNEDVIGIRRFPEFYEPPYDNNRTFFLSFLASPQFIKTVNEAIIEPQNGPCIVEDEGHKDGSADKDKKIICLSSRIERVGIHSISYELLALGVHEVAHLIGEDEFFAKGVQNFVMNYGKSDFELDGNKIHDLIRSFLVPALEADKAVQFNVSQNNPLEYICESMAKSEAIWVQLQRQKAYLANVNQRDSILYNMLYFKLEEMRKKSIHDMDLYCKNSKVMVPAVAQSYYEIINSRIHDTRALINELIEFDDVHRRLQKFFPL